MDTVWDLILKTQFVDVTKSTRIRDVSAIMDSTSLEQFATSVHHTQLITLTPWAAIVLQDSFLFKENAEEDMFLLHVHQFQFLQTVESTNKISMEFAHAFLTSILSMEFVHTV